jgi:hypothetical protein
MPRRSRYGRGRWATGTPVWLNGTPQGVISDPTMFCSRFRDLRRVGRLTPTFPSHGVLERIKSKSLAMRVVFLVLFCCARMARSCSINRPSNLGRAFYLHVDTCYKRTGRSLRTRRSDGQTNDKDDKTKKVASDTMCFVEYVDCLESDTDDRYGPERSISSTLRDPVVHYPVTYLTVDTFLATQSVRPKPVLV